MSRSATSSAPIPISATPDTRLTTRSGTAARPRSRTPSPRHAARVQRLTSTLVMKSVVADRPLPL
ncbi:hypothetical protein [Amycolatopsis kentuckyensis]|uniref:hypothetical protein n=1 Tax=Amycolatopsis kentuckyensis TaxID=218823 RepID=UPI003561F5B2